MKRCVSAMCFWYLLANFICWPCSRAVLPHCEMGQGHRVTHMSEPACRVPSFVLCRAAPLLCPCSRRVCECCLCCTTRSSLYCLAGARVFAPTGSQSINQAATGYHLTTPELREEKLHPQFAIRCCQDLDAIVYLWGRLCSISAGVKH